MFLAGAKDGVIAMAAPALEAMPNHVTDLRINELIDGIGHWTQQEAPEATNEAMLRFLKRGAAHMSERIVIVGSGIAGMCTALALAKRGLDITVLERDTPPPEGDADKAFFEWPRRGAAQFRHPHAFLGLMCNLLQDNYPDLLEEFYAAGARRLDMQEMLSPELQDKYTPEPGDEKLWVLLCRRATIETVLRRYVERMDNIRIVNGITIDGLVADKGCGRHYRCAGAQGPTGWHRAVWRGDTGRRGGRRQRPHHRFSRLAGALGAEVPEEDDDAEIVYYTRHYQLNEGVPEPAAGRQGPVGRRPGLHQVRRVPR